MVPLLLYSHLVMETLEAASQSEVSWKTKLVWDEPTFYSVDGSEVERSAKAILSTDEQEETSPPMDHCYTQETYDDSMGHVAIPKCSTALTGWHHFNNQSPLPELQNKQRKTYRYRWYQLFQLPSVL
mmetsp:Transcript_40374/g.46099  ORF Transcript_40374/g.46099 Transcript_40374/m.46099 type:complete len:127 (+) Transcript_40374:320-700(+)